MNKKQQYNSLFSEIKSLNHKQNQILEDADQLVKDMGNSHKDFLDKMKNNDNLNQELNSKFDSYLSTFNKICDSSKKNFEEFEAKLKQKDVVKKNSLFGIKFDELFDVANNIELPTWFEAFKQNQFKKLEEILEDLANKLYKARVTQEIKQNRERLCQLAGNIANDLQNNYEPKNLPKQKIIQFEKVVCELQQYDNIIPQILGELTNKAASFAQNMLMLVADLNQQCELEFDKLKKNTFSNDDSFKYEFSNIQLMDPSKVRALRYNIAIRNEDLITLHYEYNIAERIPLFFTEFLKERNDYLNKKQFQQIYVMNSQFFETLVPPGGVLDWNNINYSGVQIHTNEYSGMKNTIFDKYERILISVLLSQNNFILAEIRSKPDKEILIYDSDFPTFSVFHDKIVRCLRAYIAEEIRNKTEQDLGDCVLIGQSYLGRSVNCPQISEKQQNGMYFLMNLKICSDGKNVQSLSYGSENINRMRMDLFTTCLRIGQNQDRAIPFDVLL